MTDKTTYTNLAKVHKAISNGRPGVALLALRRAVGSCGLWHYSSEIDDLENSYRYMVNYMIDGGADPGRVDFVEDLSHSIRRMADRIDREVNAADAPELYYAKIRTSALVPENIAALVTKCVIGADNQEDSEQTLINLFNAVWTTFPLSAGDVSLLVDTAAEESNPPELRSQIISALMLGVMKYYERERLEGLLAIYDRSSSLMIKARSLMAFVIAMYAMRDRVASDRRFVATLRKWCLDEENCNRLGSVILDIVRTLDTERINKTLQEDFMPAVSKLKPGIDKLMKEGGLTADGDLNPEWEELMASSGLDKKLRDLTEMQEEGADLMMFAFSNLKSFGFFQELSNWFLPFNSAHSSVNGMASQLSPAMLSMLDTPGMMCDSDKYSFALSLMRTPEAQRKMMFSQMQANEDALRGAVAELALRQSDANIVFKRESECYIRNLNRFFKLFREHSQFKDVLHHPFSITDLPVIGEAALSDAAQLKVIGEFYLRRGYYRDALEMFRLLEKHEGADSALIEKIGYCLQKLGDNGAALVEYRKAELFNPDSLWLVKHIAQTARQTGCYADAAEYYEKVIEREENNVAAMMNLGNCLVELGKNDEALKLFYKVAYLRPDHLNSLRAIAWVEFISGNAKKSLDYYSQVLVSREATPADWLNAGHAHLVQRHMREAVEHYRRGVNESESVEAGLKKFVSVVNSDKNVLMSGGVGETEIALIMDHVICSFRE